MKMAHTALAVSIALTIGILILTIITITKGYGYKHKIDPIQKDENESIENNDHPDNSQ